MTDGALIGAWYFLMCLHYNFFSPTNETTKITYWSRNLFRTEGGVLYASYHGISSANGIVGEISKSNKLFSTFAIHTRYGRDN